MDVALAVHAVAQAAVAQHLHGAGLEDAGPDPLQDVAAALALDDDVLDAGQAEEVGQQRAGRAGAHDRDLGSHHLRE